MGKWLKELQEERRLHEEKTETEQKAQLERKRLFIEHESKTRAAGNTIDYPDSKHYSLFERDTDDLTIASSTVLTPEERKAKKPVWCQSEQMAETNDEANLLDFVNCLDFDAYNEDLELQSLMGQVKARIEKLKCEKREEETKLQTCVENENASLRAKATEVEPVVDFVPQDVGTDGNGVDNAKSIANSVMSESSIASVHSKKSLAALVSKARERRYEMVLIDEEGVEQAVPPPILSTVSDDNGARIAKKKSINKLAFINRNPAI